jgi:hypothetical protein
MNPVKRIWLSSLVVLAGIAPVGVHVARADDEASLALAATPITNPATVVRAVGSLVMLGPLAAGVELSQRLSPHLGVDATIAYADLQFGHPGVTGEVLGRWFLFDGHQGVSVGLGPSLFAAQEFGPVAAIQSEVAYELRLPRSFSLLVGAGPNLVLNDSGKATCPETGFLSCFLWQDQYHAGEVGLRARLALGKSF